MPRKKKTKKPQPYLTDIREVIKTRNSMPHEQRKLLDRVAKGWEPYTTDHVCQDTARLLRRGLIEAVGTHRRLDDCRDSFVLLHDTIYQATDKGIDVARLGDERRAELHAARRAGDLLESAGRQTFARCVQRADCVPRSTMRLGEFIRLGLVESKISKSGKTIHTPTKKWRQLAGLVDHKGRWRPNIEMV